MDDKSQLSFGRYRLESRIGKGGMGDVWIARCEGIDGPVVVKRLLQALEADRVAVDRFFDELVHARLLQHPNIVRVFDGGRIGDTHFLAMEWIDGLHLRECLRANGGPLQPALAAALVAQAAAGLAYAHAAVDEDGAPMRLVHRDISPDNLMLDTDGVVKVLDFGVARSLRSLATTLVGLRQGKLLYMAPDYLEGGKANPCTDVYSLGTTLFELCTGQPPFGSCDDPVALLDMLRLHGQPPADDVRPDVPRLLAQVITDATRSDPAQRLPDMAALLKRLEEFFERYPPPGKTALAKMAKMWMAARQSPPPPAPSLGQLELTAVQPATWEPRELGLKTDPVRVPAPAVHVAHQLDLTIAVSLAEATKDDAPWQEVSTRPAAPAVQVAHPLDLTAAVSLSEATAREAADKNVTRPVAIPGRTPAEPKVIVADEISGVVELPPRKPQQ